MQFNPTNIKGITMIEHNKTEDLGIGYTQLDDLLSTMDVFISPSELHGWLCGQLTTGAICSNKDWLKNAAVYLEREQITNQETETILCSIYQKSLTELASNDFNFQIILPDDNEDMPVKAGGLGLWCQGFIAGFGHSKLSVLSDDAKESLMHINEIAHMDNNELEENKENEINLMEVSEYVRMATILLYSEVFKVSVTHNASQSLN